MADIARKCPHCSTALQEEDNFCPQCGANLNILGKMLFSTFLKDHIQDWSAPKKGSFSNLLQKSILRGSGWKEDTVNKLMPEGKGEEETRKFRKYVSKDPFKELGIKVAALVMFLLFMLLLIRLAKRF